MRIYLKCTKCDTVERQNTTPTPSGEDYAIECDKCGNELKHIHVYEYLKNGGKYENMLLGIMNKK